MSKPIPSTSSRSALAWIPHVLSQLHKNPPSSRRSLPRRGVGTRGTRGTKGQGVLGSGNVELRVVTFQEGREDVKAFMLHLCGGGNGHPKLERSHMCSHTDQQRHIIGMWCGPELYKAVEKDYMILHIHVVWHFSTSCSKPISVAGSRSRKSPVVGQPTSVTTHLSLS